MAVVSPPISCYQCVSEYLSMLSCSSYRYHALSNESLHLLRCYQKKLAHLLCHFTPPTLQGYRDYTIVHGDDTKLPRVIRFLDKKNDHRSVYSSGRGILLFARRHFLFFTCDCFIMLRECYHLGFLVGNVLVGWRFL